MNPRRRPHRFSAPLVAALVVLASSAALALGPAERPTPAAACRAWSEHFGDLIAQHRAAHEVDEATLTSATKQFGTARAACFYGDFRTGLQLYETIPLGPVRTQPH